MSELDDFAKKESPTETVRGTLMRAELGFQVVFPWYDQNDGTAYGSVVGVRTMPIIAWLFPELDETAEGDVMTYSPTPVTVEGSVHADDWAVVQPDGTCVIPDGGGEFPNMLALLDTWKAAQQKRNDDFIKDRDAKEKADAISKGRPN